LTISTSRELIEDSLGGVLNALWFEISVPD